MSTTRRPEHRSPLARAMYRCLQHRPPVPRGTGADETAPARVGIRAAAELESGALTLDDAVARLGRAGLPSGTRPGTLPADDAPAPSLDEITAVRLVLEPAVAARAATRATPGARERLLRRSAFLGGAATVGADTRRLFRHDHDAHDALQRLATGEEASPDVAGLCTRTHRRWMQQATAPSDVLSVVRPHLADLADVLSAVAAGDPGRARSRATAYVWGTHLMLLQAGADLP